MKKFIAALLAALMLFSFAACTKTAEAPPAKESEGTEKTEAELVPPKDHSLVALKSENYEITNGMLSFFYLSGFYNVYSGYGSYFSSMGFDKSKPLSEQNYAEDMTWHDYFLDMTLADARNFLYFAEAAKEAGYDFGDLDAKVDKQIETTIKDTSVTIEQYLVKMFGSALDVDDLRSALELQICALDYYNSLTEKAESQITEKVCQEHYDRNTLTYSKADFISYTINANTSNTQDTEGAYAQAEADAKALLAQAEAEGVDGFKSWVSDYMTAKNKASSTPMEEDALKSQIDKILEGTKGASYTEGEELAEWAFAKDRAVGDCKLTDNGSGSYAVTVLTALPYRDESATKDVCHILIDPADYESEANAYGKAEEVLAQWKAGEATMESFEALSGEYNADGACLYENVRLGEMVEPFENWVFDSSRKTGDTGIVETDYGYHIMYFVGEGLPQWQLEISNELVGEAVSGIMTEYTEKYSKLVTENQENIDKLPDTIPQSAFESESINEY